MSTCKDSPRKINTIFDYYETAVKTAQGVLKALKENGEYVDINDGNPIVKSSEGAFLVIHSMDRISMVPATDEKIIFLSGVHLNREGRVVYTSNSHGGAIKPYKYIRRMINEFNKKTSCDALKIKTILMQNGSIINIDLLTASK